MKMVNMMVMGLLMGALGGGSTSFAGAPGPFEICNEIEQVTLKRTDGLVRGQSTQYEAALVASEIECKLQGEVTGYQYNVTLILSLPSGGLINPGIDAHPVLVDGNFMFKDQTRANGLAILKSLSSLNGLNSEFKDTYVGRIHLSPKSEKIGINRFVESIRGFSFYFVSDEIPTTRLQSRN